MKYLFYCGNANSCISIPHLMYKLTNYPTNDIMTNYYSEEKMVILYKANEFYKNFHN